MNPTQKIASALLLVAGLALPWFAGEFYVNLISQILIAALFASSLNLLVGYAGLTVIVPLLVRNCFGSLNYAEIYSWVSTGIFLATSLSFLIYGRIVDLTTAYAEYLRMETDEPTPDGLANLRTPPDMIGYLRGGKKSREAAEAAVAYVKKRMAHDAAPAAANGAAKP
mgnify:CR=1 FL=1